MAESMDLPGFSAASVEGPVLGIEPSTISVSSVEGSVLRGGTIRDSGL